ncbi:MAG: hypothetical protein AB1649_04315 [Chloroflexota bacterium]
MSVDLAKIRFLAANYSRLQGLKAVPIGILVVFVSVWAMYNHGPSADLTAPILSAIGAAILYWLASYYYDRTFGQVKQTRRQRTREAVASVLGGLLGLLAFVLDTTTELPLSALGLVFAATFLEYLLRAERTDWGKIFSLFPENIVAAILILVISILPVFGLNWWEAFGMRSQLVSTFMVIGIVIIVTGVWGHVRIVRALPVVEAKTNDHAL